MAYGIILAGIILLMVVAVGFLLLRTVWGGTIGRNSRGARSRRERESKYQQRHGGIGGS